MSTSSVMEYFDHKVTGGVTQITSEHDGRKLWDFLCRIN